MASITEGINTTIAKEDWAVRLQEELDEPTKFSEICDVIYTDFYTVNNPYLTDPSVSTNERGTPYTFSALTRTNESVSLSSSKTVPQMIDRASLTQMGYDDQMEVATRQAVLLKEAIETAVYADHAAWTNLGDSSGSIVSGSTSQITVSATNVDDIITAVVREIREANGESLYNRNGGFIVWRPADFELVQRFAMANGYSSADQVLINGVPQGFRYGGLDHFSSNLLASNHNFAGVKKAHKVYILRGTYGQVMVDDKDPGLYSAISVVSRVDFNVKTWNKVSTVLYDLNVA